MTSEAAFRSPCDSDAAAANTEVLSKKTPGQERGQSPDETALNC